MQVLLRAPFDTFSGYGNDAVDMAIWMRRCGVDVVPYPFSLLPGLPREFLQLLEKAPLTRPDVAVMFGPPHLIRPEVAVSFDGPIVGWSMWERSALTVDDLDPFDDHAGQPWRPWSTWLAQMLVCCAMNVEAFQAVDPDLAPAVVPCGIDPDPKRWPVIRRDADRPMRVLWVGTGAARKDPFALLKVWRNLKQAHPWFDAQLTLHSVGPGLHPGVVDAYGPDVAFSNRPLQHEDLVDLYVDHDLMVTVSRGEGNNKPAMEFLATGGAVAATDWSGHQNWLHPDSSFALRGDLLPVAPQSPAQEFHVDPEHLAEVLMYANSHRPTLRDMGRAGAVWIRSSHSWEHVIGSLQRLLEALR